MFPCVEALLAMAKLTVSNTWLLREAFIFTTLLGEVVVDYLHASPLAKVPILWQRGGVLLCSGIGSASIV